VPGSTSSGLVPLRPLTIGEIYDGAIRAIRRNPRVMAGFAAVVVAVLSLVTVLPQALALGQLAASGVLDPDFSQTAQWSDVATAAGGTVLTLALLVVEYVLGTALVAGLVIVAVDSAVRGRTLGARELLLRCRPRIPKVIGLALLIIVSVPLLVVLCMVPGILVALSGASAGLAAGLMVLGLVAGGVMALALVAGYWAVAAPVLLLENTGVLASLRRSMRLVRHSFWRVVGIGLLTAIIVGIIRQIFLLPFSVAASLTGPEAGSGTFTQTVVQLLIINAGSTVAGAIFLPFSGGVSALLYFDLRIRREGLDVDLLRPDAA
jgi:hypothetical protein